jgi:lipopolysaccharide transport system ATP-binding protein
MKPAVEVTNLSKSYLIAHLSKKFLTLRDAFREGARSIGRRLVHPFTGAAELRQTQEVFWALRDVSFRVEQGARVGIIGRNGAGKSTLLKILSRITPPTSGRATIRGRVGSLLEVGTGFHPDLTGRENIFLNGAVLGMSNREIRSKFDEIVAFAEVDRFLDTPVKRYSSGMYVRLAFSVAAHLTPEILIVDEVLAVGDAEFQKKCLGMMQEASRGQGRTVLFVSHNMAAIQALCSEAIFLERGQIAAAGPAGEVVGLYTKRGGSGLRVEGGVKGAHFELVEVQAANPDGSPLTTFAPAVITVRFRTLQPITDAGVHVILEDVNGSPVLGLETKDFVEKVHADAGQMIAARFHVESLPLTPGLFRVRLYLRSHSDHIHWEVPALFDLSVEETLVYGVRRIERAIHGTVAARVRAEVRGE